MLEEFQVRDFVVTFESGLIYILKSGDQRQTFLFSKLHSVEKADLDLFKGEFDCPWKFKFTLMFNDGPPLLLFARTRKERSIWMQTFCRVLDV